MKLFILSVVSGLCLATSIFAALAPPAETPEPGTMLLLGGGLIAVGTAAWAIPAHLFTPGVFADELVRTPAQTEGPFYPLNYPADSDNDLVHVTGHAEPAKGSKQRAGE